MKKEKALMALFDGKVLRGRDTELRIKGGQLQERHLPEGSWYDTNTDGWLWGNFEIAVDPVDFMTAWKDMSENEAKYQFENDRYFVKNGYLFKGSCCSPPQLLKNKLIEGEWYKV